MILGGLEGDGKRLMVLLSRVAPGTKHRGCALRCKRRSSPFKNKNKSQSGKARVVKRSNALENRSCVQRMCMPSTCMKQPGPYFSETKAPRRTEHEYHPAASAKRCVKVARAGLLRVPGQRATAEEKKGRATAV